jgi:chromate transporter
MGLESLVEWQAIVVATLSFIAVFGLKNINAIWIVIGGSLVGYFLLLI